jgi:hypothetical protein
LLAEQAGLARGGEVFEHVSLLHPESRHDGKHTLDESTSVFAVGAETPFSPEHGGSNGSLCCVVGRIDAGVPDEREERPLELEDLSTHTRDLFARARRTGAQESENLALDRSHAFPEARPREGSVADPMPEAKHLVAVFLQHEPDSLGFHAMALKGFPMANPDLLTWGS